MKTIYYSNIQQDPTSLSIFMVNVKFQTEKYDLINTKLQNKKGKKKKIDKIYTI